MVKKSYTLFFVFFLVTGLVNGQFTGSYSYDFRDGTIITNGQSPDGKLALGGNYSHHGSTYGMNMKVDGTIDISVSGSSTIRFLGSAYSSLNMVGTAVTDGDLGTQDTKVAADLSDTFDFVYSGGDKTLNFKTTAGSGNDLYLPVVDIIPAQEGGNVSLTSPSQNIVYYFDLRDGSIIPNQTDLNGNYTIEQGLFKVESGSSNAYGYNGAQHGSVLKTGNQITLKVAGNSYIKVGGSIYSNGTISASSSTGSFDVNSKSSTTLGNFGNDGSTVDFLYVGNEGTVTLDFTGTNYVPYIEISPVPYDVTLTSWVQKSGTVTINGVEIGFTAGVDISSNATVTVSSGTVVSATATEASILIDLGGNELSSFTPALTGNIASTQVNGNQLIFTLTDDTSDPKTYTINIKDNSQKVTAEPGKTYSYNFANGSELPQTSYQSLRYDTYVSQDGIFTINSNSEEDSGKFGYHDAAHGAVIFPGNSMDMIVAGNATVSFIVCTYGSATDAVFEFTDENSNVLGSVAAQNIGGADGFASNFSYAGPAGQITATLKSAGWPSAEVYIHGMTIENAAIITPSDGKTDVWDFGAEQLDTENFNNKLDEDIINGWYDSSITEESAGNVLPGFTAGVLSWVGGGNDRLRTSNTNLTRYDENVSGSGEYSGRLYVNGAGATGRYLSLTLSEDDEVTLLMLTQSGGGKIHFEYILDPAAQTDIVSVPGELTEVTFVAKAAGAYHIYDSQDKPSYYRVYRKDASYITITGTIDVSGANGLPNDYTLLFTNAAGKTWTATLNNGTYNVDLPAGYVYDLSLANANGYIISSGNTLEVTESTTTHDIVIVKVELYSVTGSITGLGDKINNLDLAFIADPAANKIYTPEPVIDAGTATYSVMLEPNCEYTISASGVNDYYIPSNTLTIGNADANADVAFEMKPLYNVNITATGLTPEQKAALELTFTNLYEDGYKYEFTSIDAISLRDGTYSIAYSGVETYPVEMGLTSNMTISEAGPVKELVFSSVSNWSFDDQVIENGTPSYKGLLFNGIVRNEVAKGHLTTQADATIQVPVKVGDIIRVTYYYSADFTIDGTTSYSTSSNSTSTVEFADYTYPGTEDGYVTITIGSGAGTTYITNIEVGGIVDYQAVITVGADKDYQTINEAFAAIRKMDRPNNERVTIMIDPGNYEEMLVVDVPNVTLKNAATEPSIALENKGVDIADGAVRITSYYGHGYNYYSMGSDQKWNAEILRINKENGYLSYENKGAGTTNGSYWNSTVVITAGGFEADYVIFENSFNQYISKKESEDVIEMWESGSKGERPTDYGNTSVQGRSYVERAAAIAITKSADKVVLNTCRVVGRQDSFYGSSGARVVVYKGAMMGAVDYIFGGMTAVFYKSDLVMNTSDSKSDAAYLTAAQQSSGRGYLMYECSVKSTIPGTETASAYKAKPGFFGRPWQATTSEVVFYNTTIEKTDFPGSENVSLINTEGWKNTLGGESSKMYEFGTIEVSGVDNSSNRAVWSTVLTAPVLTDGTEITTFNFTKGTDNWDPLPELINNDIETAISVTKANGSIQVYAFQNRLYVSNVMSETRINLYNLTGALVQTYETNVDNSYPVNSGFWIVELVTEEEKIAVKIRVK